MTQLNARADWDALRTTFLSYRDGDSLVVERLFSVLGRMIRSFFLARTQNAADSDDLMQAALLKIHLARHSFNQTLSLKTWVFTIAHRTLIDHWRKRSDRNSSDSLEEIGDYSDLADSSVADVINQLSLRQLLKDALGHLKPLDRTIVYLNTEEGLTMAEIAAVVGSTEGAIKVRMHRTFKVLRQHVETNG